MKNEKNLLFLYKGYKEAKLFLLGRTTKVEKLKCRKLYKLFVKKYNRYLFNENHLKKR